MQIDNNVIKYLCDCGVSAFRQGRGYIMKKKPKKLPRGYSWKDGRYMFRFTVEGNRYTVYGKTQDECEEKANQLKEDLKNHVHIDNKKLTLSQYYTEIWLEEQKKNAKESTLYYYEKQWNNIKNIIGDRKIRSIQKLDIIAFQKSLMESKSIATVNRCTKHLKQVFNGAVADRIIVDNPCNGVRPYKDDKPEAVETNHRALDDNEIALFLEYAKNTHYFHLYLFLLKSGVRIGEACALSWSDIDYDKREIRINKTLTRVSNTEWTINTPKTKTSIRTIPLTKALEIVLEAQKKQNSLLFDNPFERHIFLNTRGQMTNYKSVSSAINSIIEQLNKKQTLKHFSVHAFRDTFATKCIEQGMQPQTLKVLLGHSSLTMTMDLYAHVMPNTKAEELNRIVI